MGLEKGRRSRQVELREAIDESDALEQEKAQEEAEAWGVHKPLDANCECRDCYADRCGLWTDQDDMRHEEEAHNKREDRIRQEIGDEERYEDSRGFQSWWQPLGCPIPLSHRIRSEMERIKNEQRQAEEDAFESRLSDDDQRVDVLFP